MSALKDLTNFISTVSKETNKNPQGIASSVLLLEKAGMMSITKAMENFSEAPKHFGEVMNAFANYAEKSQVRWGGTFEELIKRQKEIAEKIEETKGEIVQKIDTTKENIATMLQGYHSAQVNEFDDLKSYLNEIKQTAEKTRNLSEGLYKNYEKIKEINQTIAEIYPLVKKLWGDYSGITKI